MEVTITALCVSILHCVCCRQQESECMCVQFLCQPDEDKDWYYHWQKSRLRWWKKVSAFLFSPYLTHSLTPSPGFQLAVSPENFSLVETPASELPEHCLQESFIRVCHIPLCLYVTCNTIMYL